MSDQRERAEQLSQVRRLRIEQAIDREVAEAEAVYLGCKQQADPYAMHKAIEALSLAALTTFANARATEIIETVSGFRARQQPIAQEQASDGEATT